MEVDYDALRQLEEVFQVAMHGDRGNAQRLRQQLAFVLAPTPFNEQWERQQFEDRTYAFYLQQREKRAAAGKPITNDTEQPTARELMFARNPVNGDYLVWAYQAAWSGWRMARGGA